MFWECQPNIFSTGSVFFRYRRINLSPFRVWFLFGGQGNSSWYPPQHSGRNRSKVKETTKRWGGESIVCFVIYQPGVKVYKRMYGQCYCLSESWTDQMIVVSDPMVTEVGDKWQALRHNGIFLEYVFHNFFNEIIQSCCLQFIAIIVYLSYLHICL